jgi:ribosome assembly protein YihI (activator of Der GTPase)
VVNLSDEYSSSDTLSKSNQRFVEKSGIKLLRSIDEIIDNLSIVTSEEEVVN